MRECNDCKHEALPADQEPCLDCVTLYYRGTDRWEPANQTVGNMRKECEQCQYNDRDAEEQPCSRCRLTGYGDVDLWEPIAKPQDVALRYDSGKPRFDLLSPLALYELAKVAEYGSRKYADRNWEKGLSMGRLFAPTMRHLMRFLGGETLDDESGLHNLAHAMWGCMAMMQTQASYPELDDRSRLIFSDNFDWSACGKEEGQSESV